MCWPGESFETKLRHWKDRHIEIGIPHSDWFKGLEVGRTRTRECHDFSFSFATESEDSVSRLLAKGSCRHTQICWLGGGYATKLVRRKDEHIGIDTPHGNRVKGLEIWGPWTRECRNPSLFRRWRRWRRRCGPKRRGSKCVHTLRRGNIPLGLVRAELQYLNRSFSSTWKKQAMSK